MKISAITLVSSTILLAPSLVLASKSLRLFSNPGCSGSFVACNSIAAGACCSSNSFPFASWRLSDNVNVFASTAFPQSGCAGSGAVSLGGGFCAAAPYAMRSARWTSVLVPTTTTSTSTSRTNFNARPTPGAADANRVGAGSDGELCVEPTLFGYVDEEGNVFEGVIPEDRKEEVIDVVKAEDVDAIKALVEETGQEE